MADQSEKRPRTWQPWRAMCALLMLGAVVVIWVTRADQLLANNRAYPLTLVVVGLFALLLLWTSRPRPVR